MFTDADSDKGEEQLIIQPEELFGNLARKWQQRSQLDCDSNLQTEKKAFSGKCDNFLVLI